MKPFELNFIMESNAIEGIRRTPLQSEIKAYKEFMKLDKIEFWNLATYVNLIQPGAKLRLCFGENVQVGNYSPPPGGPNISRSLMTLLDAMADNKMNPYEVHYEYEKLHPFTDGNGRSGRILWWWMMARDNMGDPYYPQRGFLHTWYYQSLEHKRVAYE